MRHPSPRPNVSAGEGRVEQVRQFVDEMRTESDVFAADLACSAERARILVTGEGDDRDAFRVRQALGSADWLLPIRSQVNDHQLGPIIRLPEQGGAFFDHDGTGACGLHGALDPLGKRAVGLQGDNNRDGRYGHVEVPF